MYISHEIIMTPASFKGMKHPKIALKNKKLIFLTKDIKISDFQYQELHIVSDEKLKNGDFYHLTDDKKKKKIIATTNSYLNTYELLTRLLKDDVVVPNIPDDYIQRYINDYNVGNIIKNIEIGYSEYENKPFEVLKKEGYVIIK